MADYLRTAILISLLFFGSWVPAPAHAAEPEPVLVRSGIDQAKAEIWVGQRVILHMDVLARDGWAQIKTARDFEVPGAYVVRLETQGIRLNETIAGYEYGGQRNEMSLFAQQGGKITVPPIDIDVEVRRWGDQAGTESLRMKTPAVAFDVKIPPGAENLRGIVSTTELKARQRWEPRSKEFEVGDVVKRTITLSAPDISGMAFTPVEFPAISGIGIYPGESDVADSYSRGSLMGNRTEAVTYVFEKEGSFELPKIVIVWWDLGQKEFKRIVLPSFKVKVSAGPMSGAETASETTTKDGRQMRTGSPMLILALLVLLSAIVWRYRHAIQSHWQAWRNAHRQTEKSHFHRFCEACRKNDPKAAYNLMVAWLNAFQTGSDADALEQFLDAAGCETLYKEVDELSRRLFKKAAGSTTQPPWSGKALCREARCARNEFLKRKAAKVNGALILSPLNPFSRS